MSFTEVTYIIMVLLGLIYANLLEWIMHKHILHRWGKDKYSKFHFHIEHHAACSRNNMQDSPSLHEAFYLFLLSLGHTWLLYFSTWFFFGAMLGCVLYWCIHTKAHSAYPNANWCVTYPLWDIIFRTYRWD